MAGGIFNPGVVTARGKKATSFAAIPESSIPHIDAHGIAPRGQEKTLPHRFAG